MYTNNSPVQDIRAPWLDTIAQCSRVPRGETREVAHTSLAQELTLAVVSKLHANPQRLVFP